MINSHQIIFLFLCTCSLMSPKGSALQQSRLPLKEERSAHRVNVISGRKLDSVAHNLEDLGVFKRALKNILVPRVVGTESHDRVHNYIVSEFNDLGWNVEIDQFKERTPIGELVFKNIIATHNPNARRYLDIACHYDSKYFPGTNNFVGATDSAVPCAMMIQLAHFFHESLKNKNGEDVGLRFIFFDGEEAFKSWSKSDSLYGARHLAEKWERTPYPAGGRGVTELDRIDMLVLLDLLGAKNPEFYSFFPQTENYYKMFANAESKLNERKLLTGYSRRYFHRKSTDSHIEDDHLPFLKRYVPIVHLITVPFPREWHTPQDNRRIIDLPTTQNLMKIISVFIMEYLNISF